MKLFLVVWKTFHTDVRLSLRDLSEILLPKEQVKIYVLVGVLILCAVSSKLSPYFPDFVEREELPCSGDCWYIYIWWDRYYWSWSNVLLRIFSSTRTSSVFLIPFVNTLISSSKLPIVLRSSTCFFWSYWFCWSKWKHKSWYSFKLRN